MNHKTKKVDDSIGFEVEFGGTFFSSVVAPGRVD